MTYFCVSYSKFSTLDLLASLVDDLLQEVRELLDDGDGLPAGQTHPVHRSGGVVRRPAQSEHFRQSAGREISQYHQYFTCRRTGKYLGFNVSKD